MEDVPMPVYEYVCLECGAAFEKLVLKTSEMARVVCPACESQKLEERVSSFASVSKAGASDGAANCAPSGG
jgi:putative FmdB family regulatory protein